MPVQKGLIDESKMSKEDLAHADSGGSHNLIRGLVKRFAPKLKNVIQSASRYQPVPEYDDSGSPAWTLMRSILTHWSAAVRGKPFLLCPIPLYHHIEGLADASAYRERFAELAESTTAILLDPYPSFSRLSDEERRNCRFATDVHLTPYGHSILASALEPGIRQLIGAQKR